MKKNILIVDDMETNRYFLEILLKGNGNNVILASNGEEALEAALANPPDLIISDVLMPVLDGFSLCKKCKANDTLKNIPFIFYTATYTEPQDEEFALHLGADRYIIKPQDPDVFIKIIKELLFEINAGNFKPRPKPEISENIQLREYNQTLIRKLEDKMIQLEASNNELTSVLKRYRTLLSTAPDAIFIIDENNMIIEVNKYGVELFGYSAEELSGMDFRLLFVDEDKGKINNILSNANDDDIIREEFILKCKNNSIFNGSLSFMYVAGIGTQVIIRDITIRIESERQIKDQLDELKKWYDFTMGREERMIELKNEVNDLLIELNRKKKYLNEDDR